MELQIFKKNGDTLINYASSILKKHNGETEIESFLNTSTIPDHIKGQVCLSVIKNISRKNHFSVCEIDNLAKMHNIHFTQDHSAFFSSLHCVDWADMTTDTKEYLFALIIKYFEKTISKSTV